MPDSISRQTASDPALLPRKAEPVRKRTLILLRWVAIAGQGAAVVVAWLLGLRFPLVPVLALITAAAMLNLWLMMASRRPMSRDRVVGQLAFDLVQLSALLALTGGLSNPFTLMVLAPVTVAAASLGARETALLGLATVILMSLAAIFGLPLRDHGGATLAIPPLLSLGHWLAIVIGVAFFAAYAHRVTAEMSATENALFATQMALAREQRLQHLGGVVAAAAHEMGTPLATIKLITTELQSDLSDRPELAADLRDLRISAERCTQILRGMGQAGKDDLLLHSAPLAALLDEAAAPHAERGARIVVDAEKLDIRRDAAIVHGLRNLVQNAVDFARAEVRIHGALADGRLVVTIEDDGPGFSPAMLARLAEPYPTPSPRSPERDSGGAASRRREYEGMGLGLFIARTLLERSGARLRFSNGPAGANVKIEWPAQLMVVDSRRALGENPPIGA